MSTPSIEQIFTGQASIGPGVSTGQMMLRRLFFLALAAFSVVAAACSGGGSEIEPADSYDSLKAALEAAGMQVDNQGENNFLFSGLFSVSGIELTASGEQILAFEFATPEEASEQAALVSEDGYGIGLKYVNWIATPQFFKNGKMIVVYDGSQSLVTSTLIAAMGEQFAGESPDGA
ncbi:MAG: hypothetical protein IIC28_03380 [Chloroflexi bacterium]|nr:hypothetical protein [Chloroflexota bacterium]MCI0775094.1 hypothetical protein [Chloroflexota bacterium]MCI0834837.1 hypothetical protein [Chloroflexota bacterium]MCI0881189.1 hypothetical protein [Chloroflexota bacterium]TDI91530.1 MAG: hypothetical protein E2O75_04660 [Chloroflexota bacterium]